MSPISIPGKVTLQMQYSTVVSDPDATAYLQAVEAADGQTLEIGVAQAVNDFVVGCKADGIWSAIKASCILAGARTLSGALVPLVGTAPTNFNFVSGDYNRETGLMGDGSTKYLDSNRNNNADPQNSRHLSASVQESFEATTVNVLIGGNNVSITSVTQIQQVNGNIRFFGGSNVPYARSNPSPTKLGLYGLSRNNSSNFVSRFDSTNQTHNDPGATPYSGNHFVFCVNGGGTAAGFTDARLSFYSIGESLDLALLDARVTTLMSDIGAAIP